MAREQVIAQARLAVAVTLFLSPPVVSTTTMETAPLLLAEGAAELATGERLPELVAVAVREELASQDGMLLAESGEGLLLEVLPGLTDPPGKLIAALEAEADGEAELNRLGVGGRQLGAGACATVA